MRNDPIVEEVRALRNELAAQRGYDIDEIFRRIRQRRVASGLNYVRYPTRRVKKKKGARAFGADRKG